MTTTENEFEDQSSSEYDTTLVGNVSGEDCYMQSEMSEQDGLDCSGLMDTALNLKEGEIVIAGEAFDFEGISGEGSKKHIEACAPDVIDGLYPNDILQGFDKGKDSVIGEALDKRECCAAMSNAERRSGQSGKLVLCPTPLGNLGDITLRTLETLKSCDVVCAEDTRVTGKLLAAYDIKKRLERLDEALIGKRVDALIERVLAGEVVAYCSDAGMPGVSDPGMRLVARAHELGACVEVLPGASAAALAYVASGVACTSFYFGGFFPRKDSERRSLLESLSSLNAALIFYESPHRVAEAVAVMAEVFPLRRAALCRELTKLHEEVLFLSLPELAKALREREAESAIKGEIALVIDGPSPEELQQESQASAASARDRALELLDQGMRKKEITKLLCEEFDLPRNAAYDLVLEVAK